MKEKAEKKMGTVRGRLSDGTPNPVDAYVGSRVRFGRQINKMSQEELAKKLGLTFQQVQKYEKGLNRIGASRLWDLSQVLNVPIDFFYDGMAKETEAQSPMHITGKRFFDSSLHMTFMGLTADAFEVARLYQKIKNAGMAKTILNLLKTLIAQEEKNSTTSDKPGTSTSSEPRTVYLDPHQESDFLG